MINMPVPPKMSSNKLIPRSKESQTIERIQNIKLRELGIDPYEYDNEYYTEEEQEIINEALRLVTLEQDISKELEEQVKEITQKYKQGIKALHFEH